MTGAVGTFQLRRGRRFLSTVVQLAYWCTAHLNAALNFISVINSVPLQFANVPLIIEHPRRSKNVFLSSEKKKEKKEWLEHNRICMPVATLITLP